MVRAVFWLSLGWAAYVYFGYPLLLMIWSRVAMRRVRKAPLEPRVDLVIAMHNERENVAPKMKNCFELDYPAEKLNLIVSLDAPTDQTDAVVAGYAGPRVKILSSSVRRGKAAALNNALTVATSEIVVFTDARQRFDPSAIRELVANFSDPTVGAVSGQLILLDAEGRESGDAVGLYWRYEKKLRAMESEIHSVPGSTGAIYAIRRELFEPLPPKTVLDDVLVPMRIVLRGKRAIFEPAALAYDRVSVAPEIEYEKKCRTLMGNYELIARLPELLVPWKNPIFLQVVSHKVGRLLVPYCLVTLLISNLFLRHGYYRYFLVCQMAWYLLAIGGWLASKVRDAHPAGPVNTLEQVNRNV